MLIFCSDNIGYELTIGIIVDGGIYLGISIIDFLYLYLPFLITA